MGLAVGPVDDPVQGQLPSLSVYQVLCELESSSGLVSKCESESSCGSVSESKS